MRQVDDAAAQADTIVEIFNNSGNAMATVNFSIPDKVKQVFNAAFAGRNKSAIIAELMLHAVEQQQAREARAKAIDRLLARRVAKRAVTDAAIRAAREALRS